MQLPIADPLMPDPTTAPPRPAELGEGAPTTQRRPPRFRAFCRTALPDVAAEQGMPVEGLIALIDGRRGRSSLTAAAERFVAAYFHARAAASVSHPGLREEAPLLDEVLDRLR
jgi:hypothetical protein